METSKKDAEKRDKIEREWKIQTQKIKSKYRGLQWYEGTEGWRVY